MCLLTAAQTRALFGLERGLVDILGYDRGSDTWLLIGDMAPQT